MARGRYVRVTPEVQNLIDKALTVVDDTRKRIYDASKSADNKKKDTISGVNVKYWLDLDKTEARLKEMRNSKTISPSNLGYLKEASRSTYYDKQISYQLRYGEESSRVSSRTGKTITSLNSKFKWVTQAEINKYRRKELKGTATREELELLSHWQDATSVANQVISGAGLPKMEKSIAATDEARQRAIRASRASRKVDLSIGGQSDLINDLSYFLGSKYEGFDYIRDFIDWYRGAVQNNKQFLGEIEELYRKNTEIRKLFQDARGANMYTQIKKIAQAFNELISIIKGAYNNLYDSKTLDEIQETAEADSVSEID